MPSTFIFSSDCSTIDLTVVDCSAVDLTAVDCSTVDLRAVDISAVDLTAVDCSDIDLTVMKMVRRPRDLSILSIFKMLICYREFNFFFRKND